MVKIRDVIDGLFIMLTTKVELRIIFKEDLVNISADKLYWELTSTYGTAEEENWLSWKGESVSAKLVPSETLFLKVTIR